MKNKIDDKICWLCCAQATTREHVIKKSLVKKIFQKGERVITTFQNTTRILQGPDSKYIKYQNKNLCAGCNSQLTQHCDFAYDKLLTMLEESKNEILSTNKISLNSLSKKCRQSIVKYFLKELGCKIDATRWDEKDNPLYMPGSIRNALHGEQYGKEIGIYFFKNSIGTSLELFEWMSQSDLHYFHRSIDAVSIESICYFVQLGWMIILVDYVLSDDNSLITDCRKGFNPEIAWFGKSPKIIVGNIEDFIEHKYLSALDCSGNRL